MKRTGILQPGIKIECNGLFCGECRFKKIEHFTVQTDVNQQTDIRCLLFDKIIMSSTMFKECDIPRTGECLTCEVLWDEKKGYIPYK